jgi:outer membrane protein
MEAQGRYRLLQTRANVHEAEPQAEVERKQIADEVWTAYSNLNTALRQRQASVALLEAASQSYNAALQSYNYGVRNLLDVTAAQRSRAGSLGGCLGAHTGAYLVC